MCEYLGAVKFVAKVYGHEERKHLFFLAFVRSTLSYVWLKNHHRNNHHLSFSTLNSGEFPKITQINSTSPSFPTFFPHFSKCFHIFPTYFEGGQPQNPPFFGPKTGAAVPGAPDALHGAHHPRPAAAQRGIGQLTFQLTLLGLGVF